MAQSVLQPSFARGELTPELGRRVDLAAYAIGADTISNMYVLPRGGLRLRTGTKYVRGTKNSANQSRLVDFIFSKTQAYILEFGDYYIRFYMDGGYIPISEANSDPYEITTPYPVADIWNLKFEQSADTLWIVHPNHAPRRLTRTGHAAWTLTECEFTNGPLLKENDTTKKLTLSGSGTWLLEGTTVTVTASSALFNANHVGSIWGIRHVSHAASYSFTIAASSSFTSSSYRVFGDWEVVVNPLGANFDNGDLYIEKSVDDGTTWSRIKTITSGTSGYNVTTSVTGNESDPCLFRITRPDAVDDNMKVVLNVTGDQAWACFKMTAYTSSTVMTAVMQNDFSKGGTAFKTWAEAAWSNVRGWPSAICFFQNRLCFSGTSNDPNGIWKSVVDDYENLERHIPQVDDDAIYQRLVGRTVNAVQWMIPIKALVCLTDNSEWTVQPGNTGVLSYDSMKIDQQTYWGTNGQVEPVVLGNAVVFAQREGGNVRSIGYSYEIDGYTGNDLSVMADHLFDGYTIVDWAYQQTPHSILWAIRSDGALLSFTFHKEHDVWAWAQHHTDGYFESVATIPGDGQDDVYFIVRRTINGAEMRYIEMMAHRDVSERKNWFGVDCGATQTYSPATTTVSGLTWLEGKEVAVIADGVVYKKTVTSGAITLDKAASLVHVGLEFDWLFKSLQIDASNKQIGMSTDHKKNISAITISLLKSQGGFVGTTDDGEFIPLQYDTEKLFSGDLKNIKLQSGWDYDGQVIIKGSSTTPMHIIGIMPQVTVGGK